MIGTSPPDYRLAAAVPAFRLYSLSFFALPLSSRLLRAVIESALTPSSSETYVLQGGAGHGSCVPNSFRINTSESASKQRTLNPLESTLTLRPGEGDANSALLTPDLTRLSSVFSHSSALFSRSSFICHSYVSSRARGLPSRALPAADRSRPLQRCQNTRLINIPVMTTKARYAQLKGPQYGDELD